MSYNEHRYSAKDIRTDMDYVLDGKVAELYPLAITMLLDLQLFDNVYED